MLSGQRMSIAALSAPFGSLRTPAVQWQALVAIATFGSRPMSLPLALLVVVLIGSTGSSFAQQPGTGPRYSLRTFAAAGTTPRAGELAIWHAPLDASYADLTPEQRRAFRAAYVGLADGDEPPYPVGGLRGITSRLHERMLGGGFEGDVDVAVTVDAGGSATEVAVRRSPGNASVALVASAAMEARYKPAVCAGTPCAMAFPLVVHFDETRETAERRRTCIDAAARPEARVSACSALLSSRALTADSTTLYLRQRAYALTQLGEHARALADHDEVVRRLPDDPGAYASRAFARGAAGDWSGAVDDDDIALRLAPDDWDHALARARALARADRDDQAAAAYDALSHRVPTTSGQSVVRGIAATDRSSFDEAMAAFGTAIELDERNAGAWLRRADLRLARGDTARALDDAEHATRLAPKWSSALRTRGVVRYFAGQYDAAAADFDEAATSAPANRYLPIWRGLARLRAGDTLAARAQMSRALVAMDDARWPAPVLGLILGRLDAPTLDVLAQQGDRSGRDGRGCEAQFYRGEALLLERREAEARPVLESAVRTCPAAFVEAFAARAELRRLAP